MPASDMPASGGPAGGGPASGRPDPFRVVAVVVTYNRRELLLESLAAVQAQSPAARHGDRGG